MKPGSINRGSQLSAQFWMVLVVLFASGASVVGLHGLFGTWLFLLPAAAGIAGALGALVLSQRQALYTGEAVALSLVLFVVLGPLAIWVSPVTFVSSLIGAWSDALSAAPPVELTPARRMIPYALGWLAVLVGGLIALRRPSPLAMTGPLLALGLAALLGSGTNSLVIAQGLVIGLGAVLLVGQGRTGPMRRDGAEHRRWVTAAMLVVVAGGSAVFSSVLLPPETAERFDLRAKLVRPWDPLVEPSPLVTLKADLKEGRNEEVVFTVTGSAPVLRWTTAVLADYSGTVWTVADETANAPAQFVPIEETVPRSAGTPSSTPTSEPAEYRVEVNELRGPWLPFPGQVLRIDAGGADLRFNPGTGTIAAPAGVATGSTFELAAFTAPDLSGADVAQLTVAPLQASEAQQTLDLVPPRIRNLAGDLFEGVEPGMARAIAIQQTFQQQGFYDSSANARPGHSLARLAEFLDDPSHLVGYAEQYAASAAVLARIGGVPARVAVGYLISAEDLTTNPDGSVTASVVADQASAWLEVDTIEHGWVPIDVTPDRTREPQPEQLGVTINDVVIPNPPPDPPALADRQSTSQADDARADEDDPELTDDGRSLATWQAVTVAAAGFTFVPVVLAAGLGFVVLWLKRRRTRQRRELEAEQAVVAAWEEIVERFSELGVPSLTSATPSESARHFINSDAKAAEAADELLALADLVDRSAFHHEGLGADTRDDAWAHCDQAVQRLHSNRSRRERLWIATDPRPLLPHRERARR